MSEINSENSLVSIIIPVWNTEKYVWNIRKKTIELLSLIKKILV